MKSFLCMSILISLLFMSIDSVADFSSNGHPNGEGNMHQVADHDAAENGSLSDSETEDHHCCHGHTASAIAHSLLVNVMPLLSDHDLGRSPHVSSFKQSPPTPPPNA